MGEPSVHGSLRCAGKSSILRAAVEYRASFSLAGETR